MIGRLRGQVIERTSTTVLVDVHDVGYIVNVSPQSKLGVGDRADLHIHTHVREDALSLYGFSDPLEREVFDLLITVPSIGPVKAMQILATPPIDIIDAVVEKNPAKLAKLQGIGKKTAERMVVDLHDKMTVIRSHGSERAIPLPAMSVKSPVLQDLASALVNLGFRPAIADEAAASALKRLGAEAGLQSLLKDALMHAGGR
jgi:holliday junction DNA helicase RuvA